MALLYLVLSLRSSLSLIALSISILHQSSTLIVRGTIREIEQKQKRDNILRPEMLLRVIIDDTNLNLYNRRLKIYKRISPSRSKISYNDNLWRRVCYGFRCHRLFICEKDDRQLQKLGLCLQQRQRKVVRTCKRAGLGRN